MKKLINKIIIILFAVFVTNIFVTSQFCSAAHVTTQKQARDQINRLMKLENVEKSKLSKNQKKMESTANKLATSKEQYSTVQGQLNKLQSDLDSSLYEFNALDAQLKSRIRNIFKSQRTGMFQLILSARDFNSFVDVIYFEKMILNRDANRMIAAKHKAERIAQMKKDVEIRRKYLAKSIKTINSQQRDIERAIAQNQNMINKLKTDRRYYERAERELARQSNNIQNMISHTPQDSSIAVASGSFVKPIRGNITSPFGMRKHPIFGSTSFHSGVDIGGPNYGSIIASNAGKVIYSGWYGGYGKVVIIDHGNINGHSMSTLYAHMSTIKVNQGQYVKKGQVIGLEGTTGYSTGPHCHFEVRINGKPNNPLNFI